MTIIWCKDMLREARPDVAVFMEDRRAAWGKAAPGAAQGLPHPVLQPQEENSYGMILAIRYRSAGTPRCGSSTTRRCGGISCVATLPGGHDVRIMPRLHPEAAAAAARHLWPRCPRFCLWPRSRKREKIRC